MAFYYFSFKCDTCGDVAVSAKGIGVERQDELFSKDATFDAACQRGHKSTYFLPQIVEVHRKLTPLERQEYPEIVGDNRFVDIE